MCFEIDSRGLGHGQQGRGGRSKDKDPSAVSLSTAGHLDITYARLFHGLISVIVDIPSSNFSNAL